MFPKLVVSNFSLPLEPNSIKLPSWPTAMKGFSNSMMQNLITSARYHSHVLGSISLLLCLRTFSSSLVLIEPRTQPPQKHFSTNELRDRYYRFHLLVGQFWNVFYTVPQRIRCGIELQLINTPFIPFIGFSPFFVSVSPPPCLCFPGSDLPVKLYSFQSLS